MSKNGPKNYTPNKELLGAIYRLKDSGMKLSHMHKNSGIDIGYYRFYAVVRDQSGLSKENEDKLWAFIKGLGA